jgi:hypothetical protein
MTCLKGHDYWLRAPLRGYINEPSFSIVIISSIHILFTVLHGLLCYIPSILDNSCVSELCSSHLVSELRFPDPGLWPVSLSDLV